MPPSNIFPPSSGLSYITVKEGKGELLKAGLIKPFPYPTYIVEETSYLHGYHGKTATQIHVFIFIEKSFVNRQSMSLGQGLSASVIWVSWQPESEHVCMPFVLCR